MLTPVKIIIGVYLFLGLLGIAIVVLHLRKQRMNKQKLIIESNPDKGPSDSASQETEPILDVYDGILN